MQADAKWLVGGTKTICKALFLLPSFVIIVVVRVLLTSSTPVNMLCICLQTHIHSCRQKLDCLRVGVLPTKSYINIVFMAVYVCVYCHLDFATLFCFSW